MKQNSPYRVCTRLFFSLAILSALVGCGREAPFYAPARLTVTSTPAGAAIFLNGNDSGEVTPFTFEALDRGTYEVSVDLDGFVPSEGPQLVDLPPLAERELSFALTQNGITVASAPEGAAIFLDGVDTGQLTPGTVTGIDPGSHTLALQLADHHFFPSQLSLEVAAGEILDVPATAFLARSDRTVLCEGFTNIYCAGCPELTANLHGMQADPDFNADRVVILKYSMQWPLGLDPHYRYNTAENDGRLFYYGTQNIGALPTLYVDGAITGTAGSPPDMQGIKDIVVADLPSHPGFLIDVSANLENLTVPVTVTLTALDSSVDLSEAVIRVSLVQSEVNYAEPPVEPNLGETTFYWVFRDQSPDIVGLGTITPAEPRQFQTNLTRDDWDLDSIEIIAYVQNDNDKTILQAGSTMVTPVAQAPGKIFRKGFSR